MDHIRIDEGVKRGPRRPIQRHNSQSRSIVGSQSVPAQQRNYIIDQIASGRLMRDVAKELAVTPAAISQYLAQDPEYQAAKECGIEQQLERWQAEMEAAQDPLNLARGRELFRAVAWRGEREHSHRWGAKQEISHKIDIAVEERLVDDLRDLIATLGSADSAKGRELVIMSNPSDVVDVAPMPHSESDST